MIWNWFSSFDVRLWLSGVLVILIFIVCLYNFVLARSQLLPPGPWGLPIIGHLLYLDKKSPYGSFTKLAEIYGPIFRLRLGSIPCIVLADPTLVKLAFQRATFCGRPPLFVTNGILEGYGLITAEGERWKEQRRFVLKRLREYGATKSQLEERIQLEVASFIQNVQRFEGHPFDVHLAVRRTVANLTTNLVFGKTFDEDDPVFKRQMDIVDVGAEMVDVAGTLNFLPLLRFWPKFRDFMRKLWSYKAEHHVFLTTIIDEHRLRRAHGDTNDVRDFIDAYLLEMELRKETQSHFTEKQLLHLLSDLFGASLDTLKATIEWTFLRIALNPTVQYKCQQEMDNVIGRDRVPFLDDRARCPYTMATVLEAQRLASVVPLGAPHGSTQDDFLADYFIPKGTMIIPLLWAIHNDPKLWLEPDDFTPERFLDENGAIHVPENYLPFSTGKRRCVGEELAMMTLFLFISSVLHRFTIRCPVGDSSPDLTPVSGFIISPRPYRLSAVSRTSSDVVDDRKSN